MDQTGAFLPVRIAGIAHHLPGSPIASDRLDRAHGLPAGTLQGQTGVATRHYATDEDQIDMAAVAAERALTAAGLSAADIGLVISACGIGYQALPSTAPLIARRLGLADGSFAAFDVNTTCISFMTAFDLAAHLLGAGRARHALIVSSEVATRGLPWDSDPAVAALFGDGAAAAVLSADDSGDHGICAAAMEAYPSGWEACQIEAGGTRHDLRDHPGNIRDLASFQMDGKRLFGLTLRYFPAFITRLLNRAGWNPDDIDLVVPHQASPHALRHLARRTILPPDRIADHAAQIGNMIAASAPTVLSKSIAEGRIGPGSRVLMLGTAAGVGFGGLAVRI